MIVPFLERSAASQLLEGDTPIPGQLSGWFQIGFFNQFSRLRLPRVHTSAPKIVNKSADQVRNSEEVEDLMGWAVGGGLSREKTSRVMQSGARTYVGSQEIHLNIGTGFPPRIPGWGDRFIREAPTGPRELCLVVVAGFRSA